MSVREILRAQLGKTLVETDLVGLGALYRGKVRDVYASDDRLVLVTTDRVSAFDRVLGTIPFKGQLLNQLALAAFEATADVCPNHVLASPDPNVIVARRCKAYPVELVVRGHLTGSLWRDYLAGRAGAYGLELPPGLQKDAPFPEPILTPTTKAEAGAHDQPISPDEIIARGLLTAAQWARAEATARALFARGQALAAARGLILVDTKYELGEDASGALFAIDELHTPDSSRYWIAEGHADRLARGEPQQMLDKEILRGWLLARGFGGDGPAPALDDEIRLTLAERYAEVFERLLGRPPYLEPQDPSARIRANLEAAGLLGR
jgi:phosphoribosylaminoimidazole-succinocarboxamide synthase